MYICIYDIGRDIEIEEMMILDDRCLYSMESVNNSRYHHLYHHLHQYL